MGEILKPMIVLCIVTSIAGGLLGVVQGVTAEPIAKQEEITVNNARQVVLPAATEFNEVPVSDSGSTVVSVVEGLSGGSSVGYIVTVSPNGFSGAVVLMVGISNDGVLEGIQLTSHAETPGLGANATLPAFSDQFKGKSNFPLLVDKLGAPNDNQIQAITAATITTDAVVLGVNDAYSWFEQNGGGN